MTRPPLTLRHVAAAAILPLLVACGAEGNASAVIGAPANAVGVTAVGSSTYAILAGPVGSRAVFLVGKADGKVRSSFGVTGTATSVASAGDAGPLYVGVGSHDGGRSVGAIETWTLDGRKTAVKPAPAAVFELAPDGNGTIDALSGDDAGHRTILAIDAATGAVSAPVGILSDVSAISACTFAGQPYVVMTIGTNSQLAIENVRTKSVTRATALGTAPSCVGENRAVYVLQSQLTTKSIAVLALPSLLQQGIVQAPIDAASLTRGDGGRLLILSSAGADSNVRTLSRDDLDPSKAKTAETTAQ